MDANGSDYQSPEGKNIEDIAQNILHINDHKSNCSEHKSPKDDPIVEHDPDFERFVDAKDDDDILYNYAKKIQLDSIIGLDDNKLNLDVKDFKEGSSMDIAKMARGSLSFIPLERKSLAYIQEKEFFDLIQQQSDTNKPFIVPDDIDITNKRNGRHNTKIDIKEV